MSSERKEMIKYLNEIVVPVLRQKGFKGTFPHYRRILADRINLLTFQFDKWGGGFVIEIANYGTENFITYWGKIIEPSKLTVHDLNPDKRKRIQEGMGGGSTEQWFRYDRKNVFSLGNIYEKVAKSVLDKLPIAEKYWLEEIEN